MDGWMMLQSKEENVSQRRKISKCFLMCIHPCFLWTENGVLNLSLVLVLIQVGFAFFPLAEFGRSFASYVVVSYYVSSTQFSAYLMS